LYSKKLEAYLRAVFLNDDSPLNVQESDSIRISNTRKLGGGLTSGVYSFLLTYNEGSEEKEINLIMKSYEENIDPILASHIQNRDLRMCIREFDALRSLDRVGFPVPKPYFCECDSRFLGFPFVIMAEVKSLQKNSDDYLDRLAASLANLHNFEIEALGLSILEPPNNGYEFAKRWPLHFKHALNIETKHNAQLKRDFDFAINWLELNASYNFCPRFSLIHGDAHPSNAFQTSDSQITFIDWSTVDIGDPAYDVGNVYNQIKFLSNPKCPNSAEQIGERFISEYLRKSKTDIRSRLEFYQVVSLLGSAITYSSGFSSPINAYKYHRNRVLPSIPILRLPLILLTFPFLRWIYVARQVQADGELYWLKYFENFIKTLSKRT
jgi:aminoglycoside phosphotransferase (APT) family kinase protein